MQESLLKCDLVIDDIAAKGGILLIRGNAVIDAGIALETLAIHFLQHDSVVIDIIIDADFALSITQTMKSTDILRQRSLP